MVLLVDLPLDLQVHIFEFLHPSHILSLRKTCKTFQEATSRRIVWIHALNRICRDNSLFLPSFPIPDMSDADLEHAATAPFRWIALSSSEDRNDQGFLPSRTTRIFKYPIPSTLQLPESLGSLNPIDLYLVPGGRYLVMNVPDCLLVLDLGGISDRFSDWKPTNIWAAAVHYMDDFLVHPTPDGLGIRILTYSPLLDDALHVFEIYPQREVPKLVKIAELILNLQHQEDIIYTLNGNRVVIYGGMKGTVVVWDFTTNTVAGWSKNSPCLADQIIKVTEKVVILLHTGSGSPSLWIFQIPPLTTKTPVFDVQEDLPELDPVFIFKYPEPALHLCQKPDSWYNGDLSSLPLYLDVFKSRKSYDFTRCKLDIASDLTSASLIPIANAAIQYQIGDRQQYYSISYRLCEDGFVNLLTHFVAVEAYTGLISTGTTTVGFGPPSDCRHTPTIHVNMTPLAMTFTPYSFCPASARFCYTNDGDIIISDFL